MLTIIVPSYNKKNFIGKTIESVLSQTFQEFELIIIDDCSTDGSRLFLESNFNNIPNLKLEFLSSNKGANYCRNRGAELASFEYLLFLDADDILESNCLELRSNKIAENKEAEMLVFPMSVFRKEIGDAPDAENWIPPSESNDLLKLFLEHQLPWQTMQAIWKKNFFNQLNGFDMNFGRLQDVELHTRALLNNAKVKCFPIDPIDCHFRIDENRNELKKLEFLKKGIKGASQYYQKFYPLVSTNKYKRSLSLTLLEVLSYVAFQCRIKAISKEEFKPLKDELIGVCKFAAHRRLLKVYSWIFIHSPFYPKGLKRVLKIKLRIF